MKQFEVRRNIAASPERVWEFLTDARALTAGNLGLERVEGTIAPDAKIKLWSKANFGRAFALRVTEFTPQRCMAWDLRCPHVA